MRLGTATFVVGAFFALAGAAHARSPEGVDIDVSATVTERCGFQPGGSSTLESTADLEEAHSQDLVMRVDCNAPFKVTARAGTGKLVNQTAADDQSGYAFDKVYGVSLSIETDMGAIRSGRCLSTELRDGGDCVLAQAAGLGSGDGVAIDRAAVLTVDWPSQAGAGRRLAAGRYSDTVTITIGARA